MGKPDATFNFRADPDGVRMTITFDGGELGATIPRSELREMVERLCRKGGLPAPWQDRPSGSLHGRP
jgi:hypothetical protein